MNYRAPKKKYSLGEEEDHREISARSTYEEDEEVAKKNRRERMKKKLLQEVKKANSKGVCYLSRIPPKMDPLKLHQILSQYGEIQRIYLTPEDEAARVQRKCAGGFRGQEFSEGWVEFSDKRVAKRVANMLNGEQIGGKKRSQFYYDIWNIKYLSKFKWDNLTEEIACKNAIREQKLTMELSAAKKERDFYLQKVEKARALSAIEDRMKKKRKGKQESETKAEPHEQKQKLIRQVPQTRPVAKSAEERKPKISQELLAEVFNLSSG